MQATIEPALEVLRQTILNEETSPQVRLNAVDMLFRNFYKIEEVTNIEERLAALEQLEKK